MLTKKHKLALGRGVTSKKTDAPRADAYWREKNVEMQNWNNLAADGAAKRLLLEGNSMGRRTVEKRAEGDTGMFLENTD